MVILPWSSGSRAKRAGAAAGDTDDAALESERRLVGEGGDDVPRAAGIGPGAAGRIHSRIYIRSRIRSDPRERDWSSRAAEYENAFDDRRKPP